MPQEIIRLAVKAVPCPACHHRRLLWLEVIGKVGAYTCGECGAVHSVAAIGAKESFRTLPARALQPREKRLFRKMLVSGR